MIKFARVGGEILIKEPGASSTRVATNVEAAIYEELESASKGLEMRVNNIWCEGCRSSLTGEHAIGCEYGAIEVKAAHRMISGVVK